MILRIERELNEGTKSNFKEQIQAGKKNHHIVLGNEVFMVNEPIRFIDFKEGDASPHFEVNFEHFEHVIKADNSPVWGGCLYAIEKIKMTFVDNPQHPDIKQRLKVRITIGELKIANEYLLELLAGLEGFESRFQFINYYNRIRKEKKTKVLKGSILHWTKHTVYDNENAMIDNIPF